ncbi:hypothetical protein A3F29_01620 [Candidatus Roizmanbacteria bacterium RIFCSPHIGHO2_12_FULL_33_9]|uniref:AB hydrolase-1 domain-containing protein n=1 Tax=Candidatus Roizmanbacteria bacterium RIFCSPHIGHO2_12_FULL_33_9 TaxID=1802045 RepID=A0A1F7HJ92_9BACT|nr:MAG: hypothetical protein A3F29_01620 [Candidatus Roizmanbacteria bacterium RIFCSPHIGHO2_12_FULL_33_9]
MKLKLVLFISFVYFLTAFNPYIVLADETYIKNEANPIVFINEIDGWNEIGQRQPAILHESNLFKLWYTSQSSGLLRIAYAESNDLQSFNSKNLINLEYDQSFHFHDPFILKKDDIYELYFAVSKGNNYKILKTVSNDGITFSNQIQEVLLPGIVWDKTAVSAPYVIYENSIYYLFFTGWNGSEWKVGMATSNDGNIWTKCGNNPIISSASGPTLLKEDGKYVLYFHNSQASVIGSVDTLNPFSCEAVWENRINHIIKDKPYDSKLVTDPSITEINGTNYLLYSGLSGSNVWSINLATKSVSPPILANNKYVLIPGFMTTWNKSALVYNDMSNANEWKLFDFITEYKGIIDTLDKLNIKLNKDLFIFSYDWRRPLLQLSNELYDFINQDILSSNPNSKIYLLGHSFGGLIGRLYTQQYPGLVQKIITVGTPHLGTAQVYKPVEAGQLNNINNFLTLAQSMVLNLNREIYKTNKDVLNELVPSLKDIYPIYDFLKDKNGIFKDIQSLNIKNETLNNFKNVENISDKLYSLYSDTGNAIFGYKIDLQSPIHKLLNTYNDGFPIETLYDLGDYNIASISSSFGENSIKLKGDHEEIIYRKNSIIEILKLLDLSFNELDISEGKKTDINPSLIFIIKSPGVLKVEVEGKIYSETNGIIFIPNANSGKYNILVEGVEKGKYIILAGLIDKNENILWKNIYGEIISDTPTAQIDSYELLFNSEDSNNSKINENNIDFMLNQIKFGLKNIENDKNVKLISQIFKNLDKVKINLLRERYKKLNNGLLSIQKQIFKLRFKGSNEIKFVTGEINNLLEEIYSSLLVEKIDFKEKKLLNKNSNLKSKYLKLDKTINSKLANNLNIDTQLKTYEKIEFKLKDVEEKLKQKNLVVVNIQLNTIDLYLKELTKELKSIK